MMDPIKTPDGFVVDCSICKQPVALDITQEQVDRWKGGMLIQRAMPNLSAGEREILISGYCDRCFKALFC